MSDPAFIFDRRRNTEQADPAARARKSRALVYQRMASMTQAALAEAMNVSATAVSRMRKNDRGDSEIDDVLLLLAHLGLKLVPETARTVSIENYEFLARSLARVMHRAPHLILEDEEEPF